ncbi:hypothetical protein J3458_003336 [Metarhizium acridum]|uniref:uncharacterized protein n=1 Tax=Metarhizium acridum TaxID=92637 RepID=UPI001C6CD96D|nr:hypothetical protein J3458_003336 [Metarhizium acridum]
MSAKKMLDKVLMTGSISVSALCCGTCGFRPTASRIPNGGQQGCADEGLAQILPGAGTLANDTKALTLFVKAVLPAKPALNDDSALDVNWRDIRGPFGRKLRFGLLPEDSTYPLHPPVRRTIAEASRLLQASGHEVVELQSDECRISEALQVAFALFALDETADGIVKAAGEPPVPSRIKLTKRWVKLHRSSSQICVTPGLKQLSGLNLKRRELISDWCRLWQKYETDAVIGPGGRTTAIEHDEFTLPPYTVLMDLLDVIRRLFADVVVVADNKRIRSMTLLTGFVLQCPACSIPFGRVTESDAAERLDLQPGQVVPSCEF